MTVRELARSIDEEPEEMVEALKLSSTEDRIYDADQLRGIVSCTPFRCNLVQVGQAACV